MKTLDEVIEKLEHPSKAVFERDGMLIIHDDDLADALHYLKEYRTTQTAYIKAMADIEDNPPLTWDELRQMVGKPVWVEYESYTPDWEVIENVGATRGAVGDFTGNFIETHMSILHKEDQGKTWQAYRKERHENA